jgi:hypothetical protein
MDAALRAGVAMYNEGEYHAAHDAWEDPWLELPKESEEARLLQGLIQFTAAVYHARNRNWAGAVGLAESAREYLSGSERPGEGPQTDGQTVNRETIRAYLDVLAADPAVIERTDPPKLTVDGVALSFEDLRFEPTAIAATVLAEEYGFEPGVLEDAANYARSDLDDERTASPFVTLVMDFLRQEQRRPVIHQRLRERVQRRRQKETDVEGLF